ncbi:MAG TPA: peptidase S51 [Thermoanaerobaculia bacterium]|nr:peptidase S51 [Thermoanaerobaculia bacterium]
MRLALALLIAIPLHASMTRYDVGNPADVVPVLHGPIIHLAGGGGDVDAAYQEVIDRLRGCTDCAAEIDVVVLRASGGAGYNDYLDAMPGVDSVTTFVITDRVSAFLPEVVETVRKAEYVFFAGGDQCNYEKFFNGGPIEEAIRDVYARGGAIGGTSAGMAIQGKVVYDACGNDVSSQSALALADPYNEEISFTTDFFDWPHLENVVTDTHFQQRNRMGRLLAFLARQLREGGSAFLGIAANEKTAVLVDDRGMAHVVGTGPAYFVLADHFPERAIPGQPLTYCGYKIWRVPAGTSYDLVHRPRTGFRVVDVNEGVILGDPY